MIDSIKLYMMKKERKETNRLPSGELTDEMLDTLEMLWEIVIAAETVSRDHKIDHACYCVLCKSPLGRLIL